MIHVGEKCRVEREDAGNVPDRKLHRYCVDQVRRLERRCAFRIFVLSVLVRRISEWRGRRSPMPYDPVAGAMCGLWLSLPDADVIGLRAHHPAARGTHRAATNSGTCSAINAAAAESARARPAHASPDLEPGLCQDPGRGGYSDTDEQQAELIATLIRVRRRISDPGRPGRPARAERRAWRLLSTFDG